MTDGEQEIKAHRVVTLLCALLAGMSAVSTAVAPAILHI